MTGDTAGHGAPQEARVNTLPAQRAVNLLVRAMLRTPGLAQFIGDRLVTLYVIGRKTERRYAIRVAYVLDGDRLLIGTSFGWCRNLRTGDPIELRLKADSASPMCEWSPPRTASCARTGTWHA
jgi:hypothetical protein